jgi:hypothetical protein
MGLSAMPSSNAEAGQKERLPAQSGITLGPHFAHFFVGSSAPVAQPSSLPGDCVAWRARGQAPGWRGRHACAHKQMSRRYRDNVTRPHVCLNDDEQDAFK